jgi:hypothetical protein
MDQVCGSTPFARVDAVMLGDDTGSVLRKMGKPDLWGSISYNEFPADNCFSFDISYTSYRAPDDLPGKFTWVYEDKSRPFDPWDHRATFITFFEGRVIRTVAGTIVQIHG